MIIQRYAPAINWDNDKQEARPCVRSDGDGSYVSHDDHLATIEATRLRLHDEYMNEMKGLMRDIAALRAEVATAREQLTYVRAQLAEARGDDDGPIEHLARSVVKIIRRLESEIADLKKASGIISKSQVRRIIASEDATCFNCMGTGLMANPDNRSTAPTVPCVCGCPIATKPHPTATGDGGVSP